MNKLRGDVMMVLGVLQIGDEDFKVLSVLMMGTIINGFAASWMLDIRSYCSGAGGEGAAFG